MAHEAGARRERDRETGLWPADAVLTMTISRREMLAAVPALAASLTISMKPSFQIRGVVLTPNDLTWTEWPDCAKAAGLTTIALHPTRRELVPFIKSEPGQQ